MQKPGPANVQHYKPTVGKHLEGGRCGKRWKPWSIKSKQKPPTTRTTEALVVCQPDFARLPVLRRVAQATPNHAEILSQWLRRQPKARQYYGSWNHLTPGVARDAAMKKVFYILTVSNPVEISCCCSLKLKMAVKLTKELLTQQMQSSEVPGQSAAKASFDRSGPQTKTRTTCRPRRCTGFCSNGVCR